jgi:cytoskeletal protein CcmA (bactofilin family)
MFEDKSCNVIDSIIGRNCSVEGSVVFRGGLRVDGHIRGNVMADPEDSGYLMLSSCGKIEGSVRVAKVVIGGAVAGNLHASDMVELKAGARIIGDVTYLTLAMRAGASVAGKLCHQPGLARLNEQETRLELASAPGSGTCQYRL